ncbi:hypothetical protein BDF14DRAFT_1879828 [Spinellus fusiger]|nr:hypothetical protein BDF14DRAFT_1879828 [Spinellus fusiger]
MHSSRGRSLSQVHEEELMSIESHADYVKKVLKWSITDLDRFHGLLKARVAAEEVYITALQKISKNSGSLAHESHQANGEREAHSPTASFQKATHQYENYINRMIEFRQDLITSMKQQMNHLITTKESTDQEIQRKSLKMHLEEGNKQYTDFKTKDMIKLHKSYVSRCNELQVAKQQVSVLTNTQDLSQETREISLSTHHPHVYNEETTTKSSNENIKDVDTSPMPNTSSPININGSPTSVNQADSQTKKKVSGFMASMRNQLANAAAAAAASAAAASASASVTSTPIDTSKQNVKFAKLKKEISDADQEYRQGILTLESHRKTQIARSAFVMKEVEREMLHKSSITKTTLREVLNKEILVLSHEINLANASYDIVENVDEHSDLKLFISEYEKKGFISPTPVQYDNFYYGKCKDMLFGASLESYYKDHRRTIPLIVSKCIDAVENLGGLQKEGIYRISGRQTNLEALKIAFEQNEDLSLLDSKFDVFTIASTLKIYLRELEEPLFDLNMGMRVEYARVAEKPRRLAWLQTRLSKLSDPHRDTLYALVAHLARVNANSHINKMNLQNLSVIFTPAIFKDYNQAEVPGEWTTDVVFEDLVLCYEEVFMIPPMDTHNRPMPNLIQKGPDPSSNSVYYDPRTPAQANSQLGSTQGTLPNEPVQGSILPNHNSNSINYSGINHHNYASPLPHPIYTNVASIDPKQACSPRTASLTLHQAQPLSNEPSYPVQTTFITSTEQQHVPPPQSTLLNQQSFAPMPILEEEQAPVDSTRVRENIGLSRTKSVSVHRESLPNTQKRSTMGAMPKGLLQRQDSLRHTAFNNGDIPPVPLHSTPPVPQLPVHVSAKTSWQSQSQAQAQAQAQQAYLQAQFRAQSEAILPISTTPPALSTGPPPATSSDHRSTSAGDTTFSTPSLSQQ